MGAPALARVAASVISPLRTLRAPHDSPCTSIQEMTVDARSCKLIGKKGVKIDLEKPLQNGDIPHHVLTRINRPFYRID
jgi:hypothetical protein